MSRNSKHRKKLRRARNKLAQAEQLAPSVGVPRVRRSFSAQARSGDEVVVAFEFSGVEVPFDPNAEDPGAGVARAHAAVEAWATAGNPMKGSA